jgi:hypothetical protein
VLLPCVQSSLIIESLLIVYCIIRAVNAGATARLNVTVSTVNASYDGMTASLCNRGEEGEYLVLPAA